MDILKLKNHLPDSVYLQLPKVMEEFNINGPLRLSHFLSQCDHESGHFKAVYENLNYSSEALTKLFGRYFKGIDLHAYERNPEKIGSRIYANRMGNGAESSKEGYKFRGRGYIQLTGKSNYESFSEFIGEDCVENPDLVSTKYPLASAAFFFTKNKLWQICDKGATDEVVLMVTKRVNGGTIGYDDRLLKFKTCYSLVSQG